MAPARRLDRAHVFVVTALAIAAAIRAVPGAAQDTAPTDSSGVSTVIAVDTPLSGGQMLAGQPIQVAGWAADPNGPGPGVDQVQVYLDGRADSVGLLLGSADYGSPRPDVADVTSRPDWLSSGYAFTWDGAATPGFHTLFIYAHSAAADSWSYATAPLYLVNPPQGSSDMSGAAPAAGAISLPPPPSVPFIPPPPSGPLFSLTPTIQAIVAPDGTVSLSWLPWGNASEYRVYRSNTPDPWGFALVQSTRQRTGGLATNLTVRGQQPGAVFFYQVRAVDESGAEFPVPTSLGNVAGYVPTLSAVASYSGLVNLSWAPLPTALSYRVYQSSSGEVSTFSLRQTIPQGLGVPTLNSVISGLTRGAIYYFQVRAVNDNGQETLLPAASIGLVDVVVPPFGLAASAAGTGAIGLTWGPIASAVSYRVYQSTSGVSGSFSPSVLNMPTSSGATVSGLNTGTTYWFFVTSVASTGQESPPSSVVTGTTQPAAAATSAAAILSLVFAPASEPTSPPTVMPTATPAPTFTPLPPATATPPPTNTPAPTNTSVPASPTATGMSQQSSTL